MFNTQLERVREEKGERHTDIPIDRQTVKKREICSH